MMKKVKPLMFVCRLWVSLCLFACLTPTHTNAQVRTHVLGANQLLSDVIPWYFEDFVAYYDQPIVDLKQVLATDKKMGLLIDRVAVKLAANYTEADGVWSELGDFMVWQLGIRATSASSLSFICSHLQLPEDAQMYIYGTTPQTVIGPIESRHIYEGRYATDAISGGAIVLTVLVKKDAAKLFAIQIESISQGIGRSASNINAYFGLAADCNFDVNCPIGSDWKNERDAVASIYIDGAFQCTGSLVNNACQDMLPNFLTAFHCLDLDGMNGLETKEIEKVKNYVFRFNYQTDDPACPGNSRGDQGDWLTFSGSSLLATFRSADVALLRLNGNITGNKSLAMMGWNRSTSAATSGMCIHHPRGDAKKISSFEQTVERRDNFKFKDFLPSGNRHWLVARWSQGVTETGSSGSPLINQDHQLVGVLSAGESECKSAGLGDVFGRFDNGWTGGGTPETMLSHWLGGTNAPEMINTIRVPWVNTNGSDVICTINQLISLENPLIGKTITWSVTPTTLFANSMGATTTGVGEQAVLRAATTTSQGNATIVYLLSENGCEPVKVEKQLWIGKPAIPRTDPSGVTPVPLNIGQSRSVRLISAPGIANLAATWSASGAASVVSMPVSVAQGQFKGIYTGVGNWTVKTSNACGVSPNNYGRFNVSGDCTICPRVTVNNPIQGSLSLEVLDNDLQKGNDIGVANVLELIDPLGNILLRKSFYGNFHQIEINDVPSGTYFAKVNTGARSFITKIVVIK